jgi:heme/copper-type cytochrome/quinol oxidase subunit 4
VSGEFQEGRNVREETRVGRLPKVERLPVITSCSVHQIILRIFYFIFLLPEEGKTEERGTAITLKLTVRVTVVLVYYSRKSICAG